MIAKQQRRQKFKVQEYTRCERCGRPHSVIRKFKLCRICFRELAHNVKREGYIRDYEVVEDNKQGVLRLFLKYGQNEERVITGLKRISKPGRRVYAKAHEVPRVLNGLGTAVVSTSNGVLSDKE